MLIERMDKNFAKTKFSPFFFVEVLAMVQKKKTKMKERKKRGERFRFGFYYHNRVVLIESSRLLEN
jgi:hypothetical protein